MGISRRLPSRQQSAQVLAIIVLMIYGWTILWFFWKLPTWRIFLTIWEIVGVLAFSLATAFVESLAVLCLPLVISQCLPRSWFLDLFVARGGALAATAIAYMMFLDEKFKHEVLFPDLPVGAWQLALPAVALMLIPYAAGRIGFLRRAAESLADRATVFLYMMLPLSGASIIVLLVRLLIPALRT